MRLGMYLTSLTKPELEELRELLNLTEDELRIFNELSKGKTKAQVSITCLVSMSAIDSRIKAINNKINRLKEVISGANRK